MSDPERRDRVWSARDPEEAGWNAHGPDDPEFEGYRPNLGNRDSGRRVRAEPRDNWAGYPMPDDPESNPQRRGGQPGRFGGVGPRGYRRPDERIHDEVCERLTDHGDLDAAGIDLQVQAGEVTLTGTVPDRYSKRLAERLAESVRGVVDVHNELKFDRGAAGQAARGSERIRPGMRVQGSDGEMIGRVGEARRSHFRVERRYGRDVWVPYNAVVTVRPDLTSINVPAGDVEQQGWPKA